jgi:hypothetical protein
MNLKFGYIPKDRYSIQMASRIERAGAYKFQVSRHLGPGDTIQYNGGQDMLEATNDSLTPIFDVGRAKMQLHQQDLAVRLFYAPGKRSFYLDNIELQNLYDLKVSLDRIPAEEAKRLADWIQYLGDEDLAGEIYRDPTRFKDLVLERYHELTSCFTDRNSNHQGE